MITIYKFIKRSKKKERIRNEFYRVILVEEDSSITFGFHVESDSSRTLFPYYMFIPKIILD